MAPIDDLPHGSKCPDCEAYRALRAELRRKAANA